MTTFNNNFILRAHLELADGKTCGWWQMGAGELARAHKQVVFNGCFHSKSGGGRDWDAAKRFGIRKQP